MKRQDESGFAMLLVFAMAAAVAISLYMEIPRVAFESQRAKEQLLIERGEQYRRALQVFVRKNKRYPGRIEELENTNNVRFLRKRYVDPMTGKDQWRVIHVGPGGIFTDSLLYKPQKPGSEADKDKDKNKPNPMTQIAEGPSLGSAMEQQQPQEPAAVARRRQSEMRLAQGVPGTVPGQMPGDPQAAGAYPVPGQPGVAQPGAPQPYPPQPGAAQAYPTQAFPGEVSPFQTATPNGPAEQAQQPGTAQPGFAQQGFPQQGFPQPAVVASGSFPPGVQPPGNVQQSGSLGQSQGMGMAQAGLGQSPVPANPVAPNQMLMQQGGFPPGAAFVVPQPAQSQPVAPAQGYPQAPYPQPSAQGAPPLPPAAPNTAPQPANPAGGPFAAAGGNAAAQMIQNLLFRPRPGGFPGTQATGTQIGGGIGGFASTYEAPSIIVYNERQKYNEWEFLYDLNKDRGWGGMNPAGGTPGTPVGQATGQQSTTQQPAFGQPAAAQPASSSPNAPGGTSGFGSSGFGQSGGLGQGQAGLGGSGLGQQTPAGTQSGFGPTPQQPLPQQPRTQGTPVR